MSLKLNTRQIEGVTVLDCHGRIVFGEEAAALRETVKGLLPEHKRLIINLGNVQYIDSGGLGTLVGLYTSAKASGGAIKLARLTHRTTELLQVMNWPGPPVISTFSQETSQARCALSESVPRAPLRNTRVTA